MAGGGAYYFAKGEINKDSAAKHEAMVRQQALQKDLEHSSNTAYKSGSATKIGFITGRNIIEVNLHPNTNKIVMLTGIMWESTFIYNRTNMFISSRVVVIVGRNLRWKQSGYSDFVEFLSTWKSKYLPRVW